MAIKPVTYYQTECDCCGETADYGDYSAFSGIGDAVDHLDDDWWTPGSNKSGPENHYCPDCWAYAEDMPNYDPEIHNPYFEVRKHPQGCKKNDLMKKLATGTITSVTLIDGYGRVYKSVNPDDVLFSLSGDGKTLLVQHNGDTAHSYTETYADEFEPKEDQ